MQDAALLLSGLQLCPDGPEAMLLESGVVGFQWKQMSSAPNRCLTAGTAFVGWLMLMAFAAGLIVITRGTYDLSHLYSLLPLPAWLFFLWTVGLIAANVFSAFRISQSQAEISPGIRAALVLAIPAAFLAAALDCIL